jgi:pimeloyl-ACP methyl ester carboxylesterase
VLRALRILVLFVVFGSQSTVAFAAEIQRRIFPLDRAGVDLYLERYQTDGGGEKKPILLVHGLTYSSHEFDVNYGDYSLARFLAGNGYAVWLLDIAGYGNSGEVQDGFIPDSDYAAEDIKAAAEKIIAETPGTTKLDVLGWSWGTVTGGRFAAKYPDLVDKLVLYAPILRAFGAPEGFVTEEYQVTSWLHAADDFQPVDVGGVISYDIVERPVADTFLSNCWRYDKKSPNGGRRDLMEGSASLIPLEQIEAPTLLIAGSIDPYIFKYVTVDLEEELAKLPNTDSELKIIPGAAHPMMMEKPYYKEFRESVLKFLDPSKSVKNGGGGGGGCSVGWGAAGILVLGGAVAAARMKTKKRKVKESI